MQFAIPDGSVVEMTANIMQCENGDVCVEFVRSSGDMLFFYEQFNTIKKYFGCPCESK
jgi:hypothetical protein